MYAILETRGTVEAVRVALRAGLDERPDPAWVRGDCPWCGRPLVSNVYYVGGRGYLVTWECWASLEPEPTCRYRKVL